MITTPKTPEITGPRVFVVQETSKLNLAKALKHGELIGLLPERTNITMSPQPVLRELKSKLKDFNNDDHLLLLGDPVVIAMAVHVAAMENVGLVRVLKYDRQLNDYYSLTLDLYDRMKPNDTTSA